MIEKDYFMRLIQQLFDAIQRIVNNIDTNDTEEAKQQLTDSYALLGKDAQFFRTTSLDELLTFFKTQEGDPLKKAEIVAELLYLDAQLQTDIATELKILYSSKSLFEYYIKQSKEYSFETQNKLSQINLEINLLTS